MMMDRMDQFWCDWLGIAAEPMTRKLVLEEAMEPR